MVINISLELCRFLLKIRMMGILSPPLVLDVVDEH